MSGHGKPPSKYGVCKRCGKRKLKSKLSKRGICYECGFKTILNNVRQMKEKKGPYYDHWRFKMLAFAKRLEREEKEKKGVDRGKAKRGKVRN